MTTSTCSFARNRRRHEALSAPGESDLEGEADGSDLGGILWFTEAPIQVDKRNGALHMPQHAVLRKSTIIRLRPIEAAARTCSSARLAGTCRAVKTLLSVRCYSRALSFG